MSIYASFRNLDKAGPPIFALWLSIAHTSTQVFIVNHNLFVINLIFV